MPFKIQPYFTFDPMDSSADSVRFCKLQRGGTNEPIRCQLYDQSLSAGDHKYSALSYTWGTCSKDRWIYINNTPFIIWPNLWDGLKALRREDEDIILWIDAICINQGDTSEKNHQVAQMGKIYQNATSVLVWLGPEGEDSDLAFDFINQDFDTNKLMSLTHHSYPRTALFALDRRPYWNRSWIRQELLLGKVVFLHCGSKSTSWELFSLYFEHMTKLVDRPLAQSSVEGYSEAFDVSGGLRSLIVDRKLLLGGESRTMIRLLLNHGDSKCADIRDRVFSILAIASDCVNLQREMVDYTLELPVLFLGLRYFRDKVTALGALCSLQSVLKVNFHKFIQPGKEFHDWFCRQYGTSGASILDTLRTRRNDDRTPSDTEVELLQQSVQTSCHSFFSKAALKWAIRIAIEYERFHSLFSPGIQQNSGLNFAFCCLELGHDEENPTNKLWNYQEEIYSIKNTDVALVFHNPTGPQILKKVLRAPGVAALWPNYAERSMTDQKRRGNSPPQPFDDYFNVCVLFLNNSLYDDALTECLNRYSRKPYELLAKLMFPPMDILAEIFTKLSKAHIVCRMACYYLLHVVYHEEMGSKISMADVISMTSAPDLMRQPFPLSR
jgi:hypothetical protein